MSHIAFDKGGEANVVAIDGERITLQSTISSPPGSPLAGSLQGMNPGTPIRIKVHGCRREGDGFRIEGRVIDMTRDLRTALAALLAS